MAEGRGRERAAMQSRRYYAAAGGLLIKNRWRLELFQGFVRQETRSELNRDRPAVQRKREKKKLKIRYQGLIKRLPARLWCHLFPDSTPRIASESNVLPSGMTTTRLTFKGMC